MKKYRINITTKYALAICSLLMLVNVFLGIVLMNQSGSAMKTLIRRHMLAVADTAAAALDGDALGGFTAADVGSEDYNAISGVLNNICKSQKDADIKFIYTVKKVSEKHFVFLIDPDPVEPAEYGDDVVYTPAQDIAWSGVSAVDEEAVTDEWGTCYTAWSPIKDSAGKVVGLVGVDFVADWYDSQILKHGWSVLIAACISLVACTLIIVLMMGQIRQRIGALDEEILIMSKDVEELTNEILAQSDTGNGAVAEEEDESGTDAIGAFSKKIHNMQQKIRAYMQYAQKQAYTDSMTGVGNKTAYLEYVRELNQKINNGTADFAVAVFDVDGLKNTNDNYGHECGDRIIIDTAALIRKVFGEESVFRIGGDEFIAVPDAVTEEEMKKRFAELEKEMSDFNKNKRYAMTLSFSGGWVLYRPGQDPSFKAVFKRADEAMYSSKDEHYRISGEDRRE